MQVCAKPVLEKSYLVIWKSPAEFVHTLFHHEDHEGRIDKFNISLCALRAFRGQKFLAWLPA
jgi:hypothetical protein